MTRLYSLLTFLLLLWVLPSWGQEQYRPKVPSKISFAGMKLHLTPAAQREIQKEVDLLTKSPTYFQIKADRVRLYMPIIEKYLQSENVPEDFKYLAIQESALISDAVSSSNAVGFWQFKDFTGREVGLRIDRRIDERMNVAASTVGAAKYFKRSNFRFNNWLYSLLAHMTGVGGAGKYVDRSKFGDTKMTIDKKTHWYVRRYLAHKVAFEGVTGKHSKGMRLVEYTKGGGKTLKQIAKELGVELEELQKYNKWLKSGTVPTEKKYVVIVPLKGKNIKVKGLKDIKAVAAPAVVVAEKKYLVQQEELNKEARIFVKINGLSCVLAKKGDTPLSLAKKVELHPEKFLKYNDIVKSTKLIPGQVYYLKKKRSKAMIAYHTVGRGETLWEISQKYGIRLASLAKLNRMMSIDKLEAGRLLWMNTRRPERIPVDIEKLLDSSPPVSSVSTAPPVVPILEKKKVPDSTKVIEASPVVDTLTNATKPQPLEEVGNETNEVEEELVETSHPIEEKIQTGFKKPNTVTKGSYKVKSGETLYSIARKLNVSVTDLMKWNQLQSTALRVNQTLMLQAGGEVVEATKAKTPKLPTVHVVKAGETLYGIARKYSVDVNDLLRINKKTTSSLHVGEKLKLRE